jgi:hypothetical protein
MEPVSWSFRDGSKFKVRAPRILSSEGSWGIKILHFVQDKHLNLEPARFSSC